MACGRDGSKQVLLEAASSLLSWKEVAATVVAGRAASLGLSRWKETGNYKPFHAYLFYDPRGLGFTQIEQHVD